MESLPEWLKPELIWFFIGLVLLIMEFSAPGLIIGFFGAGAWIVAGVLLFIDISLTSQLLLFIVSSILLAVFLRKWIQKVFNIQSIQNQKNLEQEFTGQHAVVTSEIKPGQAGKVEFKGAAWKAEADVEIKVGTNVEIVDHKSITLIVKPL
jgi:inner membrane protein